jgi:hypothetical protein
MSDVFWTWQQLEVTRWDVSLMAVGEVKALTAWYALAL